MAVLRSRRYVRKGVSSLQTALLVAAIGIVVVAGVRAVGTSTRGELNQTATNVGDPATLVQRLGPVPKHPAANERGSAHLRGSPGSSRELLSVACRRRAGVAAGGRQGILNDASMASA